MPISLTSFMRRSPPVAPTNGRQIRDVVFLGSGDQDATRLAERRLADAFTTLSALQQPDHPTTEQEADDCADWRAAATADLHDCALDLLTAIGVSVHDLVGPAPSKEGR